MVLSEELDVMKTKLFPVYQNNLFTLSGNKRITRENLHTKKTCEKVFDTTVSVKRST